MLDDGCSTTTVHQQYALEQKVGNVYENLLDVSDEDATQLVLKRDAHMAFVQAGLQCLGGGYVSLDASRPWLCFWSLHSLALLEAGLPEGLTSHDFVEFLSRCQSPCGGYGGGPQQMPHLAPTYAAVSALLTLGDASALESINREAMSAFLHEICVPKEKGGGFCLHEGVAALCVIHAY